MTKRAFLPPHRRHGKDPNLVEAYVAIVDSLAKARKTKNVMWEAIALDALDRVWSKLTGKQKLTATKRLRWVRL